MFLKSVYRRILLRAAYQCYLNVICLADLVRPCLGSLFWKLWFRCAPAILYRGPYRPVVRQNPASFFTADGCVDDLAKLWYNFNFDSDLCLLKRLVRKYGVPVVLHTVDTQGKTASHWIAESGTKAALKYVAKVDPDLVEKWRTDQTAPMVHLALLNYNIETAETLVNDYHLDASFKDKNGLTALMKASSGVDVYKPQDVVLRCFAFGIDVNAQSPVSGQTALHLAVRSHSQQCVHLLLRLGANRAATDAHGLTPYDYALQTGNLKLAQLLATSEQQIKAIRNPVRKLWMYFRHLFYSASARFSEGRFWVGVVITSVQLIAAFGYLLPQFFTVYFDPSSTFHLALVPYILVTLAVGYLTIALDSGFIPTGSPEYFKLMHYLQDPTDEATSPSARCRTLNCLNDDLRGNLCHLCQVLVPIHGKHCYHCGRCCLQYDHHCVFLFTCVGAANVHLFMAFTGLLALGGLQGILVVVLKIVEELRGRPYYDRLFETGFLHLNVLRELYHASRVLHWLDIMLCLKYVLIGGTLCTVTFFKWRYFVAARRRKQGPPLEPAALAAQLTYY